MDVLNTIQVYEIDNSEVPIGKNETIGIASHWNMDDRVKILIGVKSYTVIARDLEMAIKNATNHRRI